MKTNSIPTIRNSTEISKLYKKIQSSFNWWIGIFRARTPRPMAATIWNLKICLSWTVKHRMRGTPKKSITKCFYGMVADLLTLLASSVKDSESHLLKPQSQGICLGKEFILLICPLNQPTIASHPETTTLVSCCFVRSPWAIWTKNCMLITTQPTYLQEKNRQWEWAEHLLNLKTQ